jgi:hypothetical protein
MLANRNVRIIPPNSSFELVVKLNACGSLTVGGVDPSVLVLGVLYCDILGPQKTGSGEHSTIQGLNIERIIHYSGQSMLGGFIYYISTEVYAEQANLLNCPRIGFRSNRVLASAIKI